MIIEPIVVRRKDGTVFIKPFDAPDDAGLLISVQLLKILVDQFNTCVTDHR